MSPTVLVTGASGYIGRRLVNFLLSGGSTVRALARNAVRLGSLWPDHAVETVAVDLARGDEVRGACAGIETVFHLASGDGEIPATLGQVLKTDTVVGARHLLDEAARQHVQRFIFASSVKAMGESAPGCLDETCVPMPISQYGQAKYVVEHMVTEAGKLQGMHVCNIRLPMVYGGEDPKGSLTRMIEGIEQGWFPPLPEVHNKRSMVHVDDVVQALLLAAHNHAANGKTYLVTDGEVYSTREIYEAICSALGKPLPRWNIPQGLLWVCAKMGDMLGHVMRRNIPLNSSVLEKLTGSAWYSSTKIGDELSFRPTRTLHTALPEMIRLYRQSSV